MHRSCYILRDIYCNLGTWEASPTWQKHEKSWQKQRENMEQSWSTGISPESRDAEMTHYRQSPKHGKWVIRRELVMTHQGQWDTNLGRSDITSHRCFVLSCNIREEAGNHIRGKQHVDSKWVTRHNNKAETAHLTEQAGYNNNMTNVILKCEAQSGSVCYYVSPKIPVLTLLQAHKKENKKKTRNLCSFLQCAQKS